MVGDGVGTWLSTLVVGALLVAALLGACVVVGRALLASLHQRRRGPGGDALAVAVGAALLVHTTLLISAVTPLGELGGRLVLIAWLGGVGVAVVRGRGGPRSGRSGASASDVGGRWLLLLVAIALLPWAAGALAPLNDDASLSHHMPLAYQLMARGPWWVDPLEHHLNGPASSSALPALLAAAQAMEALPLLNVLLAGAFALVLAGAAEDLVGERSGLPAAALACGATLAWIEVSTAGPASAQLLFGAASWWTLGRLVRDRRAGGGAAVVAGLVLAAWAGCGWAGMIGATMSAAAAALMLLTQRRVRWAALVALAVAIGALPWLVRNGLLLDSPFYGLASAPPLRWGTGGSFKSLVEPLRSVLAVGPPADPALLNALKDTPLAFLATPPSVPSSAEEAAALLFPLVGPLLILPVALLPFAAGRREDRALVGAGLLLAAGLFVTAMVGDLGPAVWPSAVPMLVLTGARAFGWWRQERVIGRSLIALMVVQLVATFLVGAATVVARAPLAPLVRDEVGVDRWRCQQALLTGRGDRCFAWALRARGGLKEGDAVLVLGGADPQRYPGHRVLDDHDGAPLHRFWRRWISVGGDPERMHAGLWQQGVRLVHVDLRALSAAWRRRPIDLGGVDRDRMVQGGAVLLHRFLEAHATRLPGVPGEVAAWRLQPRSGAGGQRRQSGEGEAPSSSGTKPISPRKTAGDPVAPSSTR